jgi:hypothetical protein
MDYCPSNKQYFISEQAVATAAVFFEGQRPDKLYWYECEHCHGFHLTHKGGGRDEDYYGRIKAEIISKNTTKPKAKKASEESKCAMLETKRLREIVIKNNNLQEILEWNKANPSFLISAKVKNTKKDNFTPQEITKIEKMRSLVMKYKDRSEINKWNKEYPQFPIPRNIVESNKEN